MVKTKKFSPMETGNCRRKVAIADRKREIADGKQKLPNTKSRSVADNGNHQTKSLDRK
jgi:hypothetical protein